MPTSTPRWSTVKRIAVINQITAEMREVGQNAPFVREYAEVLDRLTEGLSVGTRQALMDTAARMQEFGEHYGTATNCVDQREAGRPCAHQMSDWGYRIRQLIDASAETLERDADEILNGNPAKYQ